MAINKEAFAGTRKDHLSLVLDTEGPGENTKASTGEETSIVRPLLLLSFQGGEGKREGKIRPSLLKQHSDGEKKNLGVRSHFCHS